MTYINTHQHQFDNQVVLICDIKTIVFCNVITCIGSTKFCGIVRYE